MADLLSNNLLRLLLRSGDVSFFTYLPCTSAGLDASFLLFFRESISLRARRHQQHCAVMSWHNPPTLEPSLWACGERKVNIFSWGGRLPVRVASRVSQLTSAAGLPPCRGPVRCEPRPLPPLVLLLDWGRFPTVQSCPACGSYDKCCSHYLLR